MKSVEEIIKQKPVFLCDFDNEISVFREFCGDSEIRYNIDYTDEEVNEEKLRTLYKDVNVLFAYYSYENWEGYAWVLFEKDGNLYEVSGSHCSCYGLEGQWNPEEVSLIELENRLVNGTFGRKGNWYSDDDSYTNLFAYELKDFLGIEKSDIDIKSVAENILGWFN